MVIYNLMLSDVCSLAVDAVVKIVKTFKYESLWYIIEVITPIFCLR